MGETLDKLDRLDPPVPLHVPPSQDDRLFVPGQRSGVQQAAEVLAYRSTGSELNHDPYHVVSEGHGDHLTQPVAEPESG